MSEQKQEDEEITLALSAWLENEQSIAEEMQWTEENFNGLLAKDHPQYKIERQLFMLIWFDYMQMEFDLSGRYPSETCDMSDMAAHAAYSYSWLI